MELSAWPKSTLNADRITDTEIKEIRKDLDSKDIQISTLGYYPNYLTPNEVEAGEAKRYFLKVLELAKRMEVPTVSTFIGRDPAKSVEDNLPAFQEVFSRFVDEAAKRNVNIAIENCPMMNYRDFKSENIAYSPEIWRKLFSIIPARNFGIELDPAHMVWQQIDYIKAIYEFSDRIFHIHAKDMEIRREVLGDCGIYGLLFEDVKGLGHGWWRARTPGFGEVKWTALITALLEVGYRGNIDIEHEDDVLAAAAKLGAVKEESDIVNSYCEEPNGLILGYETLSRLMPRDDN
jgi:sugar phosphate isomerase/epimerase